MSSNFHYYVGKHINGSIGIIRTNRIVKFIKQHYQFLFGPFYDHQSAMKWLNTFKSI